MSNEDIRPDVNLSNLRLSAPADYSFHTDAANSIDERADQIMKKMEEVSPPSNLPDSFPTELPGSATINFNELKESPTFGETEPSGRYVAKYFFRDNKHFGIKGEDYELLRSLSEQVTKTFWVKEFLGQKYVENALFMWCREQFFLPKQSKFTDFLSAKAKSVIKFQTICIPIALMEIEKDFTFGSVEIISLTAEMLKEREQACLLMSNEYIDDTKHLFEDISKKIQGLAAVSIRIWGEDSHVISKCYETAKDTVGLLRLYSTAAYSPWIVCPCNVLGSEIAPSKTIMTYGEGRFSFNEGAATSNLRRWRMSSNELAVMRAQGLDNVSRLLSTGRLSKFQDRVRSCLLAYSKGIRLTDLGDRLVYTFSALEGLLLKDSSEPIQQNIGERMAFLISTEPSARQLIVKNVRDTYALRSRYIHHQVQISDEDVLSAFIYNTRATFDAALNNMDKFPTQIDFITGIDRIKFGH